MTLKIRWLSALVLLLAVGAVAVRAEEEEAPPGRDYKIELLPAPLPVPVDRPCVRIMAPAALPAGMWSFMGAAQPPLPCPVPFMPAGFAPCGDGCGACTVCPCPNCPLCSASQAPQGGEYVVEMKMMEAGDDEPEVISLPRMCVMEGQTGTVQTGADGSREQSSLQMHATVTKLDKGVLLDLCVVKAGSHTPGNNVLHTHTETAETRLPVALGKTTKLEVSHDSDGDCTSWVEVTVTKAETEARMPKTSAGACPKAMVAEEEEDVESLGLSDFVEFLEDCFDAAAETASSVTGASSGDEPTVVSGEYLQQPPLYSPTASATAVGTCPSCPSHSCGTASTCTQCAATEEAKQQVVHIGFDTLHRRVVMEWNDGKKHFTSSADRLTVHDGCFVLEGHVHMEEPGVDGSVVEVTGEEISWKLPKGVDYHIGD